MIVGIDFGGTKISVAALDDGQPLTSARQLRQRFPRDSAALDIADLAAAMVYRLAGNNAVHAVSMVTPGRPGPSGLAYAPNIGGWEDFDLMQWATHHWPQCPRLISNDVVAAAKAEAEAGHIRGCPVGLYVNIGTGIAASLVIEGQVLQGAFGLAGEIGYAAVGDQWDSGVASLERYCGGIGFRKAGLAVPDEHSPQSADELGEQQVRQRLDELARHLATCVLLTDPALVVLGGGLARSELVVNRLRSRLTTIALSSVAVRRSAFGADASVIGALAFARQAVESLDENRT